MKGYSRLVLTTALGWVALLGPCGAEEPEVHLSLHGHHFAPTELHVPAGQRLRLVLENRDPTPEEFESYALNREKVVAGLGRIVVFIGPLKPGRYEFFGDYNPTIARGLLVVDP